MTTTKPCRCGHTGDDATHPCHGKGHTCGAPAVRRFITTGPAHVAGAQIKFAAYDTFACDACWAAYQATTR